MTASPDLSFQLRVKPWLDACFGPEIAADKVERNHRFLEEALELAQATGCTQSEAHQVVDYVFGRSAGNPRQETGGVMVTLAALCLAHGIDMHAEGERELARVWDPATLEKIRAKQATKPKHSPLPEAAAGTASLVVPSELTPELRFVLGMMIFTTAPVAHLFRDTGADIPRKVEDEQAFVLHWLLTLVAAHGPKWGAVAADEVDRRKTLQQEAEAKGSTA